MGRVMLCAGSTQPTGDYRTEGTQVYELRQAAEQGDVAGVRAVLEQGIDPDTDLVSSMRAPYFVVICHIRHY